MFVLSIQSGCSWFHDSHPAPVVPRLSGLPDDIPSLIELADEQIEEVTSKGDLIFAISALEKTKELLGQQPATIEMTDIDIRLAVTCFLISEREDDSTQKLAWITKGEEAAEAVVQARPGRVEGHYYMAVLIGRRIEQGGLSGFIEVRTVRDLGLKAAELEPGFEKGAPYRLLAMLYAKAPSWPTSIGDIDLALEYAEKALGVSRYALNHLIMAEVLIEDGEYVKARRALRKVLAAPKVGRWAKEGEQWRPYARQLLEKIKQED